jgi:hypothetical protein
MKHSRGSPERLLAFREQRFIPHLRTLEPDLADMVETWEGPGVKLAVAVLLAIAALVIPAIAGARMPALYRSCSALNARYPHGIGKVGAHDHTSGIPVTTFRRNNPLYAIAIGFNRGLDRDHDGIACEEA